VFAYVTGQHFFKGCNTLGTAAAVLLAVGAVAGEAHRGTLEIWLARPLSRRRILSERWVQGAHWRCACP
jgi:ABC-type transport system involved in multi-copper enzyme maturation permease subunit